MSAYVDCRSHSVPLVRPSQAAPSHHHRPRRERAELHVRPWLIATVGGVAVVFGALYLAATGYLVFRDDLLAASIARQARMQHAYEDRIASLRADIDRLTSRQLLNQEAVEAEMDRLLGRQAALDARQDIIAGLSQAARRAGIAPPDDRGRRRGRPTAATPAAEPKRSARRPSSIAPVRRRAPLPFAGASRDRGQRRSPPRRLVEIERGRDLARRARPRAGRLCRRGRRQGRRSAPTGSPASSSASATRCPAGHAGADAGVGGPFVAARRERRPGDLPLRAST